MYFPVYPNAPVTTSNSDRSLMFCRLCYVTHGQGAAARNTRSMVGKPAVGRVEKAHGAAQMRGCVKGPRPPDLAGEIDDCRGASVDFPPDGCDTHFPEQLAGWQVQKSLDTRVLQCREAEAARFEGAAEAASERRADAAVAIEENPAAGGAASF